jgi:hypothetical protein
MKIMKIELPLVSLQTAKLLKEHGFDIPTHGYFGKHRYDKEYREFIGYNDEYWGDNYEYDWNTNGEPFKPFSKDCISRPTLEVVSRWLRVQHDVDLVVAPHFDEVAHEKYEKFYKVTIIANSRPDTTFIEFKDYDECLEFGINEVLKLFV